jgi:hypothetical protein
MPSLDLNVLPFLRQNGQDASNLPGLYLVTPPRQTARGRSADQLILYFNMIGNAPLTDQQQEQLLGRLAQTYYKTSSSITAALKTVMDAMNQFLLDRNLRSSSSGKQCIGLMTLGVLRETNLIIAQSGPVHTYLVTPQENQEFYDPQGAGRGLGLTRSVSLRFYQAELHPNDWLVLTPQPPPGWNISTLQYTPSQGLDPMRRRLLSQAGPDLCAVIVLAQAGSGKLRLLRTKAPLKMVQPAAQIESQTETPPVEPGAPPQNDIPVPSVPGLQDGAALETSNGLAPGISEVEQLPQVTTLTESEQAAAQTSEAEPPPAQPQTAEATPPEVLASRAGPNMSTHNAAVQLQSTPAALPPEAPISPTGAAAEPHRPPVKFSGRPIVRPRSPAPETTTPASTSSRPVGSRAAARRQSTAKKVSIPHLSLPKVSAAPVGKALGAIGKAVGGTLASLGQGMQGLLKRILPDESLFTIPASTMIFIAVAVALIMASAGGMVYFQRGRAAQYQNYYELAVQEAERAVKQTTPLELRTAWETTLNYLDKAETYKTTPESSLLRVKAGEALDNLDGIIRLDFQPAFASALGGPAEVSRIVVNDIDLYLLNSKGGNVLHATLTGRGYEIDPNFSCGPNPNIGPLIDIAPLAKGNSFKASLLAMDVNGNLLYCLPGNPPNENAPAPPQAGWGSPQAFTLDSNNLYALDPKTNGVWIYRDMGFDHQPHLFFGDQIPPMQDVVGFAVHNDDLFLLHKDGHLTTCVYSSLQVSSTRCTDPETFVDHRQGRQDGPIILDAQFSQMLYTQPPDPSIYMLDPIHQAIYHFSVKLNLQQQFRSKNPLPNTNATAFTVTQNRTVFMAVGNQVYYASLP